MVPRPLVITTSPPAPAPAWAALDLANRRSKIFSTLVLGKGLNVPVKSLSLEEAKEHFGWMEMFAEMDLWASGAKTQERLSWHPTSPGLITNLEQMRY